LLAYEGIISQRQAGHLRFLDNRPDEQERGITMKSSAVMLHYTPTLSRLYPSQYDYLRNTERPPNPADPCLSIKLASQKPFTVHLIDSPGHVDFYGQVYCGARVSDGCIVLVDVVEGICSQTIASLRLAFELSLQPILFFNKIDRLFLELLIEPLEVYILLMKLFEQVNAACGHFRRQSSASNSPDDFEDEMSSPFYFDPRKGNVIFGSAIDGWAFRTNLFANLFSKKLSLPPTELNHSLWGPFLLRQGKIQKNPASASKQGCLFTQLILDNIFAIYKHSCIEFDEERMKKIALVLGLELLPKDLAIKDKRHLVRVMLKAWIPLASVVFDAIIDTVHSPLDLPWDKYKSIIGTDNSVVDAFMKSFLDRRLLEGPAVAYLAKILPSEDIAAESLVFLGRLYAGSLVRGQQVYFIYTDKEDANDSRISFSDEPPQMATMSLFDDWKIRKITVKSLFVLSGSDMKPVECVPAGHLFGIGGLLDEQLYVKAGCLFPLVPDSSLQQLKPLYQSIAVPTPPLLKVSIEPAKLSFLSELQKALLLLYRNDPAADLAFLETGEYILAACGELHLEQLLKDLREKWIPHVCSKPTGFAISVSPPIIPWRETISQSLAPSLSLRERYCMDLLQLATETVLGSAGRIIITERFLDAASGSWLNIEIDLQAERTLFDSQSSSVPDEICVASTAEMENFIVIKTAIEDSLRHIIISAFHLALKKGPFCAEPLFGITLRLHSIRAFSKKEPELEDLMDEMSLDEETATAPNKEYCPVPASGVLISIFKDAFHRAIIEWSPRMMLAYNSVEVHTPSNELI
jgi:ribosome assembly protein 1